MSFLGRLQYLMNVQDNSVENNSKKCQGCKTFFGCQAFKGFCSSCYKKQSGVIQEKIEQPPQQALPKQEKLTELKQEKKEEKVEQKNRNRCFDCNKKVGLLGIQCKCGYVFCNGHRMPEDHKCTFNHLDSGKQKLEKDLVKVAHDKIGSI